MTRQECRRLAGTVLDLWSRERTSIDHPDYLEISQVVGVWPVPP